MSDEKFEYDWQPLIAWKGRYRCEKTGVYGYRRGVAYRYLPEMPDEKANEIVPYVCVETGCSRHATFVDFANQKYRKCALHKILRSRQERGALGGEGDNR